MYTRMLVCMCVCICVMLIIRMWRWAQCDVSEGVGMCTHWPGDLMACVGEHVNLAVQVHTSIVAISNAGTV